MNSKMTTNSQLLTTEPKNKLSKQLEQEQNHRNGRSHGGLSGRVGEEERGKRYRE